MLVIRDEQKAVFRRAARLAFEREMVAHLREFSPALHEVIGDEQMHKVVLFGMTAAAAHGITWRGPVRLYLELMLLFGSRFDTDPQYPWASAILADRTPEQQMQRAEALYRKTLDYRREVVGYADVHAMAAYQRIAGLAAQPVVTTMDELAPAMICEIKDVYPQKAAYLGDAALAALTAAGVQAAGGHGLSTVRGIRTVVGLMLFFGHGCLDDPLYPWISRTLTRAAADAPEERAGRLQSRALIWMEQVLANLRRQTPT